MDFDQEIKDKISNANGLEKSHLIYALLDYKITNNSLSDNCYLLCKTMILEQFDSMDNNNYGYDIINLEKIYRIIDHFPIEQKTKLLYFIKRKAVEYSNNDLVYDLNRKIIKSKYEEYLTLKKKGYLLKSILLFPTLSLNKMLVSIIVLYSFLSIIFLPAPTDWMAMYDIKGIDQSNLLIVNQMLISSTFIFNFDFDLNIIPNCFLGVVFYVLIKGLYYIIFGIYIMNEIYKRMSFND